VVSVQLAHTMHATVLLIIRRSWVRAPPAPHSKSANKIRKFALKLLRLILLANPVHLDDDYAFAADVGQVHEHQRASLDGAQPWRLACELSPVEEDH
jgi:hypothetical protein